MKAVEELLDSLDPVNAELAEEGVVERAIPREGRGVRGGGNASSVCTALDNIVTWLHPFCEGPLWPSRLSPAAKSGPVFITDRGKPAHVLLSIEYYRRLTGAGGNLIETLSMPGLADIDLEPPRARIEGAKADLF